MVVILEGPPKPKPKETKQSKPKKTLLVATSDGVVTDQIDVDKHQKKQKKDTEKAEKRSNKLTKELQEAAEREEARNAGKKEGQELQTFLVNLDKAKPGTERTILEGLLGDSRALIRAGDDLIRQDLSNPVGVAQGVEVKIAGLQARAQELRAQAEVAKTAQEQRELLSEASKIDGEKGEIKTLVTAKESGEITIDDNKVKVEKLGGKNHFDEFCKGIIQNTLKDKDGNLPSEVSSLLKDGDSGELFLKVQDIASGSVGDRTLRGQYLDALRAGGYSEDVVKEQESTMKSAHTKEVSKKTAKVAGTISVLMLLMTYLNMKRAHQETQGGGP